MLQHFWGVRNMHSGRQLLTDKVLNRAFPLFFTEIDELQDGEVVYKSYPDLYLIVELRTSAMKSKNAPSHADQDSKSLQTPQDASVSDPRIQHSAQGK